MKNDTGKGRLSKEDQALWEQISGSVTPLRQRPVPVIDADTSDRAGDKPPAKKPARAKPSPRAAPAAQKPSKPQKPAPLPLTGVDRRTRQKLVRGQVDIEARIDLHGNRRLDARVRLRDFLAGCRARGIRWVLVITGKGASPYARHTLHGSDYVASPDRSGVLRDAVAGWLREADFAELVSGFQPAHPKHGGGGAFYVRLRGSRRPAR